MRAQAFQVMETPIKLDPEAARDRKRVSSAARGEISLEHANGRKDPELHRIYVARFFCKSIDTLLFGS